MKITFFGLMLLALAGCQTFGQPVVRQATDAEAAAGSNVKAYINPAQLQTFGGGGGPTNGITQPQLQSSLHSGTNSYTGTSLGITGTSTITNGTYIHFYLANGGYLRTNTAAPYDWESWNTNGVVRYGTNTVTFNVQVNTLTGLITAQQLSVSQMAAAVGKTNIVTVDFLGVFRTNDFATFVASLGGAAQSPWAGNIDGGGFNLSNVGALTVGGTTKAQALGVDSLVVTNGADIRGASSIGTANITNINFVKLAAENGKTNAIFIDSSGHFITNDWGTLAASLVASSTARTNYLKFNFARYVSGSGCTIPNTNDFTADTFMVPLFDPSTVSNQNYCRFAIRVPEDLDTNSDLVASLTVSQNGSNSGDQEYGLGMSSTPFDTVPGSPANYVEVRLSGILSGGTGRIERVNNIVLTGWKAALVPKDWWLIELHRAGTDSHDAGTVSTYLRELEIAYRTTR